MDQATERNQGPDVDIIFREPEHIEYAATLGLGVADRAKIVGSRRGAMTRALVLLALAWLQATASGSPPCVYWTGAVDETPTR